MKKQIITDLKTVLSTIPEYKSIYENIAPHFSQVTNHPSCAILFNLEERVRKGNGCNYLVNSEYHILIYAKHTKQKDYSDILSDLIEVTLNKIEEYSNTDNGLIDIYVSKIETDGGVIHPYRLADLTVQVSY